MVGSYCIIPHLCICDMNVIIVGMLDKISMKVTWIVPLLYLYLISDMTHGCGRTQYHGWGE